MCTVTLYYFDEDSKSQTSSKRDSCILWRIRDVTYEWVFGIDAHGVYKTIEIETEAKLFEYFELFVSLSLSLSLSRMSYYSQSTIVVHADSTVLNWDLSLDYCRIIVDLRSAMIEWLIRNLVVGIVFSTHCYSLRMRWFFVQITNIWKSCCFELFWKKFSLPYILKILCAFKDHADQTRAPKDFNTSRYARDYNKSFLNIKRNFWSIKIHSKLYKAYAYNSIKDTNVLN